MQSIDNRPIGIFDSGLGGLTAVRCLSELLPEERFIYFGDTARTPYGSKAVETIQRFSVEIANFLLKHEAKVIVIACNTVSATCLQVLSEKFPSVPIIGIIEPAARTVAQEYVDGQNVGIIGTKVTISSQQYEKIIFEYNDKCKVHSIACPLFVPAIEEGLANTDIMEKIVKYYMDDFVKDNGLDVLVLGCTHYPLVEGIIRKVYPNLKIVNPSQTVAQTVADVLKKYQICAENNPRENRFYASDLSDSFVKMTRSIVANGDIVLKQKNFEDQ